MDNLGSHKGQPIRRLIRAASAKLPRYSPDLNPIEQVFSKLKTLRRGYLEADRPPARSVHTSGMRQLSCQRRLRFNLK
jgi:transposase